MQLVNMAKDMLGKVRTYWRTPPLGNYMNYKEIASYAGGGIGIRFIIIFVQSSMIAVGNTFVGNTIGLSPAQIYAVYVASVLASFPLTALRAKIIDSSRSRKGKYRPYLVKMGLPTLLLSIGYVWMPYERMSGLGKIAAVLLFNIGFQFFYNFLYDAYENYVVVLSSNTQERANVSAIRAVTDSFAPTLTNAIIPILGKELLGTDSLYDIRIFRYIWPPILIIGFLLGLVIYFNTKENIIQARTHVVQTKFTDAFRAVVKNKYFWIISCAGWLGFLEGLANNILGWLYTYQHACTDKQYALLSTILGNASFWGMLLAPLCIKKFGKKNTLIFTNVLNIFFLAALYPIVKHTDPSVMIWMVMICLWMNALVGSFTYILTPSLNGDIRDYQQYITGERIDGMFAAVGLIGSVVVMLTSSIQTIIYDKVGFNEETLNRLLPGIIASGENITDTTNVYNVLYDNEMFIAIFGVLIIFSVVGAAMNVIPYFFYDLSEVKQRGMVRVLQIRALFEDYGKNVLSDKDLVKAIDIVNESREYSGKSELPVVRKGWDKASRKERNAAIEYNNMIKISDIVIEEMNRFNTPEGRIELEAAKKVKAAGYDYVYSVSTADLQAAKALPKNTPEEKEYRKSEIERAKNALYAKKVALKAFPNGIQEFDMSEFEKLFTAEDAAEEKLNAFYKSYYAAKDGKDKQRAKSLKAEIKTVKAEKKKIDKAIKTATDKNSLYNRAAKPYLDAVKLITQAENYTHYGEIAAMYDEAKLRCEEAERLAAEEEARKEAAEKEHAAMLKAQRKKK